MKAKKKRGVEVPQKIQTFISSITSLPFESIEAPLAKFSWDYDKGDFYHWVELMNHFDSFFERHIRPRKDLQLEGEFNQSHALPKEALLQILKVTRVILENCVNKHCYSSYEHLSSLLASTDSEVVIGSLQTLAAFVKKPVQSNRAVRWHGDHALNSRLFSLCQGWGVKEEGLGLVACAVENGCDLNALRLASTLHFEFYLDAASAVDIDESESKMTGLTTIHVEDLQDNCQSDLDLFHDLVNQYKVPSSLRFSLLTRLRFARSFSHLDTRRQHLSICLLAFTILVQSNPDSEDLTAFFNNEPEFVHELVSLLHCEDTVPEDIRLLAVLALAAQAHDRPRQSSVLSAISAGGNRGILPTLVQNAVGCLRGLNSNCSIAFVEALLYLVTVLVSTSAGCAALRECGLIPTLLPLLKDTSPLHTHLVASGVHILEAFMDYSNPAATLFRDLGGLDDAISRLNFEVANVEETACRHQQDIDRLERGKMPISDDVQQGPLSYPETVVSFQSRWLLKVLLRAISLGTYAPGNAGRSSGSEESLASCLCTIFRHAKEFGGGVFALAASLMSDLIHKDPTGFSALDSAGLPKAFLDAINSGVLPSSEAVSCIPHSLDALCLNNTGLETVKEQNALGCLVKIFTSKLYLRALSNETPSLLASGLDELMRHAPTLRADGVEACIAILDKIAVIGGVNDHISPPSQEENNASAPNSMESDINEVKQLRAEAAPAETSTVEAYVLEYIQNAARLLESLLQNAETSRIFVEKKGVEAFLRLYLLPNLPLSFGGSSVAHTMSSAFRAFSPTHAISLSHAVCASLRESLTLSVEALSQLGGAKISELETLRREGLIRCLSSTEMYLSLAAVLVRSTNTMMTELNTAGGDVLSDVGKVYQAVLWQVSVLEDEKAESKNEESGNASAASTHVAGGREGAEDFFPSVQYVNPVSIRDAASAHWSSEPEIFPLMAGGDGFHRRTRREQGSVSDLFSQRLRRLSRHTAAQAPQLDMEAPINMGEGSQSLEVGKRKSPESDNFEVLKGLVSSVRGLFVALGKSMVVPSRRRDDAVAPGSVARGIAASIAKLLHESLTFHHQYDSVHFDIHKCKYLQKSVEDISLLLFDSRRHTCNMLLLNSLYAHDVLGQLLQEFQGMNLVLWEVLQAPEMPIEGDNESKSGCINKKACVLETLQTLANLLDHLVTPSLLLSPQSQILVQQVTNAAVALPRDAEALVQRLQLKVLEVVLPVWNHPSFAKCGVTFISGVTSILTHIYSGVNDANDHRNAGIRVLGPPPDESSISMIVEMGFSRERAEEALRRVVTNSVEMAMEWLFSHPEEPQEDDDLARALALSLGSSEAPVNVESEADAATEITKEDDTAQAPPIEVILCTCFTLLQCTDVVVFPLTDLLVTICNRNKGQDQVRVVTYLISQLKSCPKDDLESDTSLLSVVSHFLAVILSEDEAAREVAAEQGLISTVLDILSGFNPQLVLETSVAAPKWTTALLLVLDLFLQYKQKCSQDQQEPATTLSTTGSLSHGLKKGGADSADPLMNALGKFTGFLSPDEQHHAMTIACNFLNSHIPATSVQAVLQLCARLTKTHSVAMQFLESGGLNAILSLPRRSLFPGFDSVAAVIIRHLLEDPHTLQQAMEGEIKQALSAAPQRHGHMTPRMFLTALAPVVLRDPTVFMLASGSVCKLESVNGQTQIVLHKEREKEKDKEKDDKGKEREKLKADGISKVQDPASKPSKSHHKKVPQSFVQVIEQLLELILHSPGPILPRVSEDEASTNVDKGKRKCDEYEMISQGSLSDRSAGLAKVAFVLKLMTEIILTYPGAVGVVLRRDSESAQGRIASEETSVYRGLLHHILHKLLLSTAEKATEKLTEDEWREKLSVKAAYFLLAVCIRSAEGRRRVITEISRELSSSANNVVKGGKQMRQPPSREAKSFVSFVNLILSAHASSHIQAPSFSADMAKTMIDAGLVQALTSTLQVIDLDHPDAVKFVNVVLRALEALTRAAATSDHSYATIRISENAGVAGDTETVQGIESEGQPDNGAHYFGTEIPSINLDRTGMPSNNQAAAESHTISDNLINSDRPAHAAMADGGPPRLETGVLIHEAEMNLPRQVETEAAEVSFHMEHRPERGQEDDEEEMDADEGEEDEDDEDEDEMEGAEDVTHLSPPDTDVDDQDDQALGDEYIDDMAEEEEDDWQEDQVIEVRWRDGLTRLDNVPVIGPDGTASLIDLPRDPFLSMNEIFGSFRRSTGLEHRRPAVGYRPHSERQGGDHGSAFHHPLLRRLPGAVSNAGAFSSSAGWTSGRVTGAADALFGVGAFDPSPFYMHNHVLSASGGFGEHSVSGPLPPLLDFSMDAGYMMGRRGVRSESRLNIWTDDGQPQTGAHAASIAQCIEGHYTSYLRSLIPEVPEQADAAQNTEAFEGLEFDSADRITQSSPHEAALSNDNIDLQGEVQINSLEDIPVPPSAYQGVVSIHESQDERTAAFLRDGEAESLHGDLSGAGTRVVVADRDEPSDVERNAASVNSAQLNMDVDVSRDVETTIREVQVGQDEVHGQQIEEIEGSALLPSIQNEIRNTTPEEGAPQAGDAPRNEGGQEMNTIDPTFLEALPEYLRAEVLASHETQTIGAAALHPTPLPTEDIDPEFLAALPPDIQAEVLQQQRNQRAIQTQQAEGQPVEMDSASIIATFPAELREEVLLTSTDQVLAALPPSLLAEAQLLRERAMNQYHGSGLFGGNRFGIRRHDPPGGLDRAVGNTAGLSMSRRAGVPADVGVKIRQVEGNPLVNLDGLKCLLQLLHLAQPLGKGLLQRLFLNLCAHGLTRTRLVKLLLDLLRPGAHSNSSKCEISRLYGCRSNVVYARSQVSDGVPPLVSRRVLEILTHLIKHLGPGSNILSHLPPSVDSLSDGEEKDKGKSKLIDESMASSGSSEGEVPLVLLLKLLNQPLYFRSSAHLEQLMVLLEVVTNHLSIERQLLDQGKKGAADKVLVDSNPLTLDVSETSRQDANLGEGASSMEGNGEPSRQGNAGDDEQLQSCEASTSGRDPAVHLSETLSVLPEAELRKLCNLLAQPGLSDSAYSRMAEVLKKLAAIAPAHRWLFKEELENLSRLLCGPAICEVESLSDTGVKVLSTSTLGGGAILRVLQCLSNITGSLGQQIKSTVRDLNTDLEPLWQALSSCVAKLECSLGSNCTTSSAVTMSTGSSSTPLPPETQRVLPFVEAFFVLSEKLKVSFSPSLHPEPGIATAPEIKEAISSSLSTQKKTDGDLSFLRFSEKHRRMLNAFIRQNPSLLEKSFSVLLKTPRLIDFDNKRAYFRSRIKQQQEQHHHHPLRICVRRPYVLEDSYNQLRMRTVDELKGRLTVQFQGEEGIDAGGLTREWYQILSRVIFDKGALLFTTVGNDSTFQPNPNSVFQTEHLSYFKFVGRVVAKAVFDGQLLDVYFTRSFYKHILGVKVTYHDIEAVDPDYYKSLKWMLENDISDALGIVFSVDADEEKHILYEKTEVTDVELVPGGRNIRVTEENKHEYADLNVEHKLTTAIRPQINAFLEGFNELVNRDLISIFNDKELELLISGLPEIDLEDLKANTEYTGYTAASPVVQWFWEVVQEFSKEDMARLLQFITGTSKVPLEGFRALQGISGPQRCQIHKAYGAPERLPTAHTCFNQLDLPEYSSKQQLQERLLLAIHEASEGFGFG